jgi:hypothetical protein
MPVAAFHEYPGPIGMTMAHTESSAGWGSVAPKNTGDSEFLVSWDPMLNTVAVIGIRPIGKGFQQVGGQKWANGDPEMVTTAWSIVRPGPSREREATILMTVQEA